MLDIQWGEQWVMSPDVAPSVGRLELQEKHGDIASPMCGDTANRLRVEQTKRAHPSNYSN